MSDKKKSRNRRGQDPQPPPPAPPTGEKVRNKLSQALDIPQSAFSGIPQLELAGNREAVVDGCQGVLEYNETVIRLTTGKMVIKFTGRSLQIKVLTHDSAVVEGFITGIEFIT